MESHPHLDMILVVSFHYRVCIEIIKRWYGLALTGCPVHILFSPSKVLIVVHQAQNQLNPILLSFGNDKIQSLWAKSENENPDH